MASSDDGNGTTFSPLTEARSCCFWVATAILGCFLGLSGVVVGRALSMGLSAIGV